MNRRQRRAQEAALRRMGYFKKKKGFKQSDLTERAYDRLVAILERHGNRLSDDHRTALFAMVGAMSRMAQGRIRGRWAFGLPTGMGKTTAVIAWVATLHELSLDHISVAVSASKVEALCDIKRALIQEGVPAEKIGLIHSYKHDPSQITEGALLKDGYASEPSDGATDRQIMLVSHARVRDDEKLNQFSHYRGKPRDLLLYDESLVVSDSVGIAVRELRGAVGYLLGKFEGDETREEVIAYLSECRDAITSALDTLKEGGGGEGLVSLPYRSPETLSQYRTLIGRSAAVDAAHQLLDLAAEEIRVIPTGQGGVVWYQIAVPPQLKNVFVLDASHPIRRLVQLDRSIKDAEKELLEIRNIGVPLSQTKRFDRVTLRQMFSGGGRETMKTDFSRPADARRVSKEIAEVVRRVPRDEAALVFVYKQRPSDKVDYRGVLLRDLEAAGIDVDETILVSGKPRRRINVLTWGNESSLNNYAYCKHVILAGVLQRSLVDLASAYLGQVDKLTASYSEDQIRDILNSEVCHMIYQALSRGSCRVAEDGQARPMTGYIIHRDDAIQVELEKVMPGAAWRVWEPTGARQKTGIEAATAARIAEYLSGLPSEVRVVSSRKLREDAGLEDLGTRTLTRALNRAVERLSGWTREGRGVVRCEAGAAFA